MKNTLLLFSTKATLALVFLVILAGGIVRTTGAGMGCPDWPTCFGQVIPPTSVSQLPVDYKTRFQVKGKQIAEFNAFKTWTEYGNRICGVLLGMSALILVLFMIYKQQNRVNKAMAVLLLFAIMFEGWLGAIVVASDLEPVKITLHMLIAMVIIVLNVLLLLRLQPNNFQQINKTKITTIKTALFVLLSSMMLQIIWGTAVREQIDVIAISLPNLRDLWIGQTTWVFYAHRSFSLFIAGICIYLWFLVPSSTRDKILIQLTWLLVFCVTLEILVGILFVYAGFPSFAQPIHLLLSGGIIACTTALLYGALTAPATEL